MNYCGSGPIRDVLSVPVFMFGPISAGLLKIEPIKESYMLHQNYAYLCAGYTEKDVENII